MPISHHIDLYRYWLAKRAGCRMPARRDLDPCDIPKLLPYVMIVEKVDDRFRWRLVGTAVAQEAGRDLTGSIVGLYDSTPEVPLRRERFMNAFSRPPIRSLLQASSRSSQARS
jgi:hypothetical protein